MGVMRERVKKRVKQLFGQASFGTRLSFFLLTAVTISLIAGQLLQYRLTAQQINQQDQEHAAANVEQVTTYLEMRLKNVIERLFYVRMNPAFSTSVENLLLGKKAADDVSVISDISEALSLHKITEPLISSLYLYTPRYSYTDNTVLTREEFVFEQSELYKRLQTESQMIIWGEPVRDPIFISQKEVVPVLYKFNVQGYGQPVALLANLDRRALRDYIKQMPLSDEASIILSDWEGNIIIQLAKPGHQQFINQQLNPEKLRQMIAGGEDFITMNDGTGNWQMNCRSMETAPWNIVYLRSEESAFLRLTGLMKSFIWLNLAVMAVIYLAIMGITGRMTRPLYDLAGLMSKAGEEKYELNFSYEKKDEIGVLAKSFNHMVCYSRELFEQLNQIIVQLKEEKERVRIQQLLKRRAELKALQAQINPHFLYNTLDSIRWKAEEIDAADISQMTQALATVFRIGLSRGRELIPVRDEFSHVESYLEIQCLRYGERLSYSINLDTEISGYYVVKLILQPLVENSIYHGIKEKDGASFVSITGKRQQDDLVFIVEDNGVGILPQQLASLNDGLKRNLSVSRDGYGIFNVNERLKLYFGDRYGLVLESTYQQGTKVMLTMPVIEEWEVEDYVPYSDSGRREDYP